MSAPRVGPRRLVHENPRQQVYQVPVDFGDFRKEYFVTEVGTRVGVLLLDGDRVLLVRQYRLVVNQPAWEIPGGRVDDGESPAAAAIRETFEETGLRCRRVEPVIFFHPGMDTFVNPTHIFAGREFEADPGFQPDPREITEQRWVPLMECLRMIFRGEIVDSFTITALLAHHTREQQPELVTPR